MKKYFTYSLIMLLAYSSLVGQTLRYDILRNDKSYGETVARRIVSDGQTTFHLNTKTTFRVIFSFDVEYDLKETFDANGLLTGSGFNTLNGGTQKETQMRRLADRYELVIDGIRTEIDETAIYDSVSEIYFEEPHDGKRVFSAYFGRFLTFDKEEDGSYSLTSPDGVNEYKYYNGICTEVTVSRDFATFTFKIKPESLTAVKNKRILGNHD